MNNNIEYKSTEEKKHLDNFSNNLDVSSWDNAFEYFLYEKINLFYTKWKIEEFWQNNDKVKDVNDNILNYIRNNLDRDNITFVSLEWNESNIIIRYYDYEDQKEKELVFDLNAQENESLYVWDSSDEVYAQKLEDTKMLWKHAEKADLILQVMDYVFQKNEEEWFDELNHEDIVDQEGLMNSLTQEYRDKLHELKIDFWDMNLLNLQKEFETVLSEYSDLRWWIYEKDLTSDDLLLESKQKYLDMIMWIWDKYEWAASYLKKDTQIFEETLCDIISNKSIEELLQFIIDQHEIIDSNDYQSTTVEESYKTYIEKLQWETFQRLKNENATEKQFLDFAKIITGRLNDNNIDDNLRNQELSNEVVLHIISRKDGVMDKINKDKSIVVEDEKVWNQLPMNIVLDVAYQIKQQSGLDWSEFMKTIWFWEMLELWAESYNDLTLEQKIKTSTLVRLLDKLRNTDKPLTNEYLWDLFRSIAHEANEVVIDSLNNNFDASLFDWEWWKTSADYDHLDLSEAQKDLFDIYQDINGNWLFDFSDNTIWYAKTAGKITAAIVAWVAVAPFVVWWAIATWVAVGLTATVVSMGLNPQWYDTQWEAWLGIVWELWLWAATGAVWWALVQWFWTRTAVFANKYMWVSKRKALSLWLWFWETWAKLFSRWWAVNSWIFAWDLLILWLWVEFARQIWMNQVFHGKELFEEKK